MTPAPPPPALPAGRLPLSAVTPTRNRPESLRRLFASAAALAAQPAEWVVVDASDGDATERVCREAAPGLLGDLRHVRAARPGAAAQRNQGYAGTSGPFVAFIDDDIAFEPGCLALCVAALEADPRLGGVNGLSVNEAYVPPRGLRRLVFPLLAGRSLPSYAGRCFGPAVILMPEDRPDLPPVVPIDWAATTLVMYRRAALPDPPFEPGFTGYSMLEDLTLSLVVGRGWKLANVRAAKFHHLGPPGGTGRRVSDVAAMEITNRYFVMTEILGRRSPADHLRFGLWQAFNVLAAAQFGPRRLLATLAGMARGFAALLFGPPMARRPAPAPRPPARENP